MEKSLEIIEAKYIHDHVLLIKFNTDELVEVDLSFMIENDHTGIFSPLKNIEFFRQFRVDYTLCWGDEIDVAPQYIYFLAHRNDSQYQQLFKDWGYIQ